LENRLHTLKKGIQKRDNFAVEISAVTLRFQNAVFLTEAEIA
jgi:hypothetical protein